MTMARASPVAACFVTTPTISIAAFFSVSLPGAKATSSAL